MTSSILCVSLLFTTPMKWRALTKIWFWKCRYTENRTTLCCKLEDAVRRDNIWHWINWRKYSCNRSSFNSSSSVMKLRNSPTVFRRRRVSCIQQRRFCLGWSIVNINRRASVFFLVIRNIWSRRLMRTALVCECVTPHAPSSPPHPIQQDGCRRSELHVCDWAFTTTILQWTPLNSNYRVGKVSNNSKKAV